MQVNNRMVSVFSLEVVKNNVAYVVEISSNNNGGVGVGLLDGFVVRLASRKGNGKIVSGVFSVREENELVASVASNL